MSNYVNICCTCYVCWHICVKIYPLCSLFHKFGMVILYGSVGVNFARPYSPHSRLPLIHYQCICTSLQSALRGPPQVGGASPLLEVVCTTRVSGGTLCTTSGPGVEGWSKGGGNIRMGEYGDSTHKFGLIYTILLMCITQFCAVRK